MKTAIRVIVIIALTAFLIYGYRYYRFRVAVPPLVEVEYGEITHCLSCGKLIERKVQTIKVPITESGNYRIGRKGEVCQACRDRGVQ